ncbi:MarR family transcriptional regulator [Ruania suaedae]|uniref:MarR family winged helix-turn-helix transcriptional regulator n=1 Tax=Ruania suaedae TaxID=2897774 RepID=UPI001E35F6A1|nr:MarR family transcriptional regulator [Ruania suaedae]UFU03749.1 MarR family transcriptional regulator [Ruania suaedae]
MDSRHQLVHQVLTAHEETSRLLLKEDLSTLFDATLTVPQIQLLALLYRDGPTSGHAVAEHLGVSTPTVSGMVDRLEGQGMVERRADPADRRVRLIALTGAGEQRVASVHEAGWRIGRELMERMELDDLRALARGMDALARAARS